MSVVESLTLAIPFALSHNFIDAERHPVKNGKVCWYKSQVPPFPQKIKAEKRVNDFGRTTDSGSDDG